MAANPASSVGTWIIAVAMALCVTGCGGSGGGGPAPGIAVVIADAALTEGDAGFADLTFLVTLSAADTAAITVDYSTTGATASSGTDFTAATGTLTFPAGTTTRQITVSVLGDLVDESDEEFVVSLSSISGNASLADGTATGTIRDNDPSTGGPFGLDARPSNTTCVAPARPTGNATVASVDAFPTAPAFGAPTKILQAPGDATRWFVLEKDGLLKVFGTASPASVSTWLDLTGRVNPAGEGGLLGMAFHPNWPGTPEVFISYTTDGTPLISRLSRLILDSTAQPVNFTEQVLLTVNQPFDNHNGGDIAFGPDGFLYFGLGDGGSGGDPNDYAQDQTRLLGKMLRLNVLGVAFPSPGYTIPAGNPFAANAKCGPGSNAQACPETYASGLRNPWRWSFDGPTGDLWLGDVGQGAWEEVDRIERGGNYGWRCREGFNDFNIAGCPTGGFMEPLTEYPHANGDSSITGGYVYRGTAIPVLRGRYVFGDFSSGRIWALEDDGQGGYSNDVLLDSPYNISAFAIGADTELYFADYSNGRIRRITPVAGGPSDTIPANLEDTGCVVAGNPGQVASGLIPYAVNAPFWSDGAVKDRYLAIPDGTQIAVSGSNDFVFPNGTVILKSFRLNNALIETRLFMRHPDGVWAGFTYEWNAAQTMATRVIGGKTRQVGGQTWIYPSEGECMQCHTSVAGFSLGPEISQLNGSLLYAATGRTANQLETLDHIGLFSTGLPGAPSALPALADPADAGATLSVRARAYLHTNCAQCHRPQGPTPSTMDLRVTTALSATGACNATPQSGSLGIANARLIAPGDAARSVLVARMNRRDANGMPPVGSSLVDLSGVTLLTAWVNALTSCQ